MAGVLPAAAATFLVLSIDGLVVATLDWSRAVGHGKHDRLISFDEASVRASDDLRRLPGNSGAPFSSALSSSREFG